MVVLVITRMSLVAGTARYILGWWRGYVFMLLLLDLLRHFDLGFHLLLCIVILRFLLHLLSSIGIHEVSVLVPLLGLPLARTPLHLFDLHIFERLRLPIVPLKDVFHTSCLFLEFEHLLSPVLGLELGYVLLDEVKLDYVLDWLVEGLLLLDRC